MSERMNMLSDKRTINIIIKDAQTKATSVIKCVTKAKGKRRRGRTGEKASSSLNTCRIILQAENSREEYEQGDVDIHI